MKIIICIALVAVAFFIGWNAAQMRWINKISDILDTLNYATKTYGELSSEDRKVRKMRPESMGRNIPHKGKK